MSPFFVTTYYFDHPLSPQLPSLEFHRGVFYKSFTFPLLIEIIFTSFTFYGGFSWLVSMIVVLTLFDYKEQWNLLWLLFLCRNEDLIKTDFRYWTQINTLSQPSWVQLPIRCFTDGTLAFCVVLIL